MDISKFSIKRPVTTLMLVFAAILLGFVSLGRLNLDLMPKMDLPYAIAYVTYRGAGPEEIESLITEPLEATLGTVTNLKQIFSQSQSGTSIVQIEFNEGTDMNVATMQMREKIDMIEAYLPDDASAPTIMQMDMNMLPVLSFSITGQGQFDIVELNRLVEDRIQGRIERINGVASVSVSGGKAKEITVNIYPDKLKGYGITAAQISQLLSAENLNMPVGTIKQGDMDLTVRTIGEFEAIGEIRDLPITTSTGSVIRLSDVADIQEVFKKQTSFSYVNGEPAVSLSVSKQSTANTVNVSDEINEEIEKIKLEMPDLNIATTLDQAVFIKETVSTVSQSAIYGGCLAIVILLLFLRNLRTTFIVGTSIPISIIVTFMLMYFFDTTLNMVSLGGLALGVGMLVDNSIVVLENIFRHKEMGKKRAKAAEDGTKEVAMAVTASTLTTVAVFLPIVFVEGIAAQIFKELAMTVSFSLIASLVVSLTWVPMLSSKILKIEERDENKRRSPLAFVADGLLWFLNKLDSGYQKLLSFATKHTIITTAATLAFFAYTVWAVIDIDKEFFGSMDQSAININITMPKGTLLEETEATADKIISLINDIPEKQDLFSSVGGGNAIMGGGSGDSASITLQIVPIAERERSIDEVVEDVRGRVTDIAGADISVAAEGGTMSMGGSGIDLTIYGDDMEELERVANDVRDIVADVEGTREAKTSLQVGSPEAAIKIDRRKASFYGISAAQVANALNTAVSGSVATQFKSDGTEIDIRVRQDPTNINYITDIENIAIQSPMGTALPLYEIAEVTNQTAPVSIIRENQSRTLSVTASIHGRAMDKVSLDIDEKLKDYDFPEGYSYKVTGAQEEMINSFASLGLALVLSIILVYMVMASQFESLMSPFIILLSIPIGLTGGLSGLRLIGVPLSIVGFIGLIMLAGIVVNNGIVLIDYINQLRESGYGVRDAILTAGPTRLRPILMTTLTTVLGLLPMLIAGGEGSEMQKPLAGVVVFGLTISTVVTLVYIPVLYMMMNSIKSFFKRLLRIKDKSEPEDLPVAAENIDIIERADEPAAFEQQSFNDSADSKSETGSNDGNDGGDSDVNDALDEEQHMKALEESGFFSEPEATKRFDIDDKDLQR